MLHADEARNLTNLARFYARLVAMRAVFARLQDSVAETASMDALAQFHNMKWHFDLVLSRVESWRAHKGHRPEPSDWEALRRDWDSLKEAASSREPFPYLDPTGRRELRERLP